jgi:hypothetical protein
MRYSIMIPPSDPQKKIASTEDLIARAEERVRTLEARSEPGAARMLQALTNRIRKYRRELQQLRARQADTTKQNQLRHQQRQLQQAQREASADGSSELPTKQDQEPRKPAPQQGSIGGQ